MHVDWMETHLSALKKLSEFYVPLRYPDAIAGSLPEGLPGEDDAKNALEWATAIVETIESHLS
ncbi:MAG: hypothetical protein A3H42_02125 [Deltaproteobacteria bacterium RIFCSPLOWO2_02_FULL_46_8]|nr:MAG: hypothetical protein A3H42_02125 [Deltaproteobacteria bacterium RIFCSPLOWO2_02_FULL_46_8]